MFDPLGLRAARASSSSTLARGTGVGRKERTARRVRIASCVDSQVPCIGWGVDDFVRLSVQYASCRPNLSIAPDPRRAAPASRYSTLARVLTDEIETGRYKVGQLIPTEAELQRRFDVSRHTVREALRDLKDRGLILARAGVGTVVRAQAPQHAASCRAWARSRT